MEVPPSRRVCAYMHIFAASLLLAFTASTQAVELTPRESHAYTQICAYCHARAETSAPVMGDSAEWQRRAAETDDGFEGLVRNTIVGIGNMPPLGTCGYCTETEIRNLVATLSGLAPSASRSGLNSPKKEENQ
ncbi:c-type cytochrome [bacterium]|nr:c-type cytochrome [bacterium]